VTLPPQRGNRPHPRPLLWFRHDTVIKPIDDVRHHNRYEPKGEREDITSRLAALSWWDWNHETLRRALPDFRKLGIEDFLAKYEAAGGSARPQAKRWSAAS
jgi:hypothetical protein